MEVKRILFFILPGFLLLSPSVSESEIVYLNILHTNDVHGGIAPRPATFLNPDFPPMIGGAACLATYVNQVREECEANGEYFLLLDAGDIYQGTPLGNYDGGFYVVEWMNYIGYDLMTLGNHDFDDGVQNSLRLSEMADFPVVCCNLVEAETGNLPEPLLPYVFYDIQDVKVAVIGLTTTDTYGLVDESLLEGYIFLNEVESTRRYIREVREQGAQIVILLSHLGAPPNHEADRYLQRVYEAWENGMEYTKEFCMNHAELSTVVEGIDVIISGHTHVALKPPWINPVNHTIVVQGYANGTGLCRLRLVIDTESGSLVGYDSPEEEVYISLLHDEFFPDPYVETMIDEFRNVAEEGMDEIIGEALMEIPRGGAEHPLGHLVTDAMLWRTGADVALMNRGGIRAVIPRGPVTPRIVYEALPFEENLYILELTGSELLQVLETGMMGRRRDMQLGGATAVRNQNREDMFKIEKLLIDGEPVDSTAVYTFVTTGYLVSGNVGYEILLSFPSVYGGSTLLDTVLDYITQFSPISPDYSLRIKWIDEE